jgi:acyl-CoA synthetase (AMP-forming)/AMP-acid ligase II
LIIGPTETSVITLSNTAVIENPASIGRAHAGTRVWVADPTDYNRLAPIGCSGELLLEGPVLAREYIKMPEKTRDAFVKPSWVASYDDGTSTSARRIYRTGDLVKYEKDLTVTFLGRLDNQVKLNGQRLELGEIENALDIDPQIKNALVALPKTGHFKKKLIAILSLSEISPSGITSNTCQIILEGPRAAVASTEVAKAKDRLSEKLPAFMVPSTWIVVEAIPLLPSGKLDRRGVSSWLEKIDEKTYERIMEADIEEDNTAPVTSTT